MPLMLGVSLGSNGYADAAATAPDPATISLNDFSRDKVLFDSGAGLGQNSATIAISGTGTAGRDVQARAYSTEDGGTTATPWADLVTIDGAGDWSGELSVPRSASWYRVEVRIKDNLAVQAQSANRFGVGHLIAIWGQSEVARIVDSFGNSGGLSVPALLNEDAVQVIQPTFDPQDPLIHRHLSDAEPGTVSLAVMANTLLAERPNDKFCLVFQVSSGTSFKQLVDDGDPARDWALDKALHDFATADGQHVGLAAASWFAAPRSAGNFYEEAHFPMFFETLSDGTPFVVPGAHNYATGQTYQIDHSFLELYDYSRTKWVAYGPHRFETGNESNIETVRAEWRSMAANVNTGGVFLPYGLEPMSYENGYDAGGGIWTDISHPSPYTLDGGPRLAQLTALAVLEACDLVAWAVPEFDNCAWQPDGSYVEVWSSAGPVTTTRAARSEAALDNTHPHWTDVFGFQINGNPVERAELVAGRVRIYPISGVFGATDVLEFGADGGTGGQVDPDDFFAQTWKNYPLVDVGQAGVEGIPVRAVPDPAVLANTIIGTQTFNVTAAGPKFDQSLETANIGAGNTAFTVELRVRGISGTNADILTALTGSRFKMEVLTNNNLRFFLKDSGNNSLLGNTSVMFSYNDWSVLRIAADLSAGWLRAFVDETETMYTFSSPTGQLYASSRWLAFWEDWTGEVEYVRIWMSAETDGSAPLSVPYAEISGSAATVNAHPWKTAGSADAT